MIKRTKNIGDIIKNSRQSKGYTLSKLSKLAGVSPNYLWHIEKNRKNATDTILIKIAKALKLDIEKVTKNKNDDSLFKKINKLTADQKKTLKILINGWLKE